MTIGDVLAAVAAAALVLAGWGASLVFLSLFLPGVVKRAERRATDYPVRSGVSGLILLLCAAIPIHLIGEGMQGPGKLVPLTLWALLLGVAAIGSAGLVSMLAVRIDPALPKAITLPKASAIYVLAGLCPVCGWLLITPIALCISLGSGASAIFGQSRSTVQPSPSTPTATIAEAI